MRAAMKIYFITTHDFSDVQIGGVQGSRRNYEILSAIAETVLHRVDVRINRKNMLRQMGFYFPGIVSREMREMKAEIDRERCTLIFLDSSLLGKLAAYFRKETALPVISFFHNCERDYYAMLARRSRAKFPQYLYAGFAEACCCRWSTAIYSLNSRDQRRIASLYGRRSDGNIPVTVYDRMSEDELKSEVYRSDDRSAEAPMLFVGADFPPNYEGIRWFIQQVMPELKQGLLIVGKNFERRKKDLEKLSERVTVIGTVDDIKPYYMKAGCVVLPIFDGAGMKVKTAEALMYGKYIFGSEEAFMGYTQLSEEAGRRCNSAAEYVKAIRDFYGNRTGYYCEASRKCYESFYSAAAARISFEAALRPYL